MCLRVNEVGGTRSVSVRQDCSAPVRLDAATRRCQSETTVKLTQQASFTDTQQEWSRVNEKVQK